MELMESDLAAMEAELYKELHEAVENGDIEFVRQVLENHDEEQYFSYEETSALYKAYSCKMNEIAAYLIGRGAKTHSFEQYDLHRLEIDLTCINYHLRHHNKKLEKSCIQRLLYLSQSPQGLNEERLSAVKSMYEDFFESDIIRLLMMILESEVFDIVYDFSSMDVNRIYRLNEEESEIFGLTLSNSKEIFIGARNLLSGDSRKKAKVHGVVAEELCHLAMTTIFKNDAKPYKEEDSKLIEDFWNIVKGVKSLKGRICHVESVIQDVFEYYSYRAWECELIARVPHVIGIYGKESGRRILMESSELSNLLTFYEQNVLPKCKIYADPSLNTKSYREMKKLMEKNEFISFKEKQILPLKKHFPLFKEYVVVEEGISVITTNCTKLCTLHVYHELKLVYGDLLEKKCLFFGSECFEKKRDEILNTLKCKVFEYFILILNDKELNFCRLKCEYIDHFEEFIPEMQIIIISNSYFLGPKFQNKILQYKWDYLTDEYKDFRTWPAEYIFKGERQFIFVKKEDVPEIFSEEDILRLISGEVIEVCDGVELDSRGYIPETYIDRVFQAATVDIKVSHNLSNNYNIFISGLSKSDFQELSINEKLVQWLEGSDDSIQEGKSIFIKKDERAMHFGDFLMKNQGKTNICLYHDKNIFYVRNSDSLGESFNDYKKQITITEEGMIDLLKRNKILIISDNAGHGKSTVMTSLIRNVSKNIYGTWVLQIDLSKFAMNQEDISMTNIKEGNEEKDPFDDVFLFLGLNHGLEKCCFKEFSRYSNCCFLFFDGYDEIPHKYRSKALTLISYLREKTAVNVTITTRKLHRQELEEALNTYSHQLVPFDKLAQVSYLEKLWKWKLKFPNGDGALMSQKDMKAISQKIKSIIEEFKKEKTELGREYLDLIDALEIIELEKDLVLVRSKIDKLMFRELARLTIKQTSLDEETVEFMGIPLHLYMVGIIYYDSNFNLDIQYDIYSLYSSFIEQKIRIYMEEKLRIFPDGSYVKNYLIEVIRKDAFRIHSELADQLMNKGKVSLEVEGFEGELCTSLGIVYIYGGGFNFLHQTFAEFFKAESLRKNMQKEAFVKMLFEDKYNVVRRFLSCALEKRSFENLTKEFFEDADFLVTTMVKIADVYTDTLPYESVSYMRSVSKIVRRVLEKFESVVEPHVVNQFLEKVELNLHELVQQDTEVRRKMGKEEMVYDNYMILSNIGGCLTVKMLTDLLQRDILINSNMVLNFVRFSENPNEVIGVLKECILIENECGVARDLRERENGGNGKEDLEAEALSDVLWVINLESEYSLLFYALSNDRAEMYVHILKFFRDVFEKERFLEEIVQCDSYKELMNKFILEEHPRRIFKEIKRLHSVFGNEIEILFDNDCKFWVIERAVEVDGKDEGSTSFVNALSLFEECFGMNKLEEFLLSKDYSLIHVLLCRYSRINFPENLNLIENILHNHDKMKQFLKFGDKYWRNIFHVAALKGDVSFEELHEICDGRLNRDDIKEMLIAVDLCNNNVLHSLFQEGSSDKFTRNLNFIWKILGDYERFKEFIKSKGRSSRNIFHFSAVKRDVNLDEVLRFFNGKLEKYEIKEMFISKDDYGNNVIHMLVLDNASEILVKNLRIIKEYLVDEEWFKQVIKSEHRYFGHVFHYNAERDIHFLDLLQFCDAHFEKDDIREMLLSTDFYGNNVMHSLLKNNSPKRLVKNWDLIKEVFGNDGSFKQLLKSKGRYSMNMFNMAALQKDVYFNSVLQYFSAHLDKDDVKGMLQSPTKYGHSVVSLLFRNNSFETLIKRLDLIKEIIDDDEWFKQLLQRKDGDFKSVFHFVAQNRKEINPSFLSSYIPESEIPDLLMERDVNGRTCLHDAAHCFSNLIVLFDYAKEVLKHDRSRFEQLLLEKDTCENTFLHSMVNWYFNYDEIQSLKRFFGSLKKTLSGEVFEVLLRGRNEEGKTFLQEFQQIINFRGEISKNFEEIFGRDLFDELLQRKCYYTN